jgi:hypothetical protein
MVRFVWLRVNEKELPQDIDAFVKWITPYVDQILSKNGFNRSHEITVEEGLELEKGGNVYTRDIGIGYQHIGFVYIKNIREENGAYEIHISIDTEVPKINKIYGKFNFLNAFMDTFSISGADLVNDGEFPAGHSKKYRNRIGFSAMYDKKAIFERLTFYEKLLFPFADTITDLQGLDDYLPANFFNKSSTNCNRFLVSLKSLINLSLSAPSSLYCADCFCTNCTIVIG